MEKSRFRKWYEANAEKELLDMYFEGSVCDMPLITKIEILMEQSWLAGQQSIGLGVYRGTNNFEDYY